MELVHHVVVLLLLASTVTAFPTTKTQVQCRTTISLLEAEGSSLQDPALCDPALPTLQLTLHCLDSSTMQCVQLKGQVSACGHAKPSNSQTLEVATKHSSQVSRLSLKLRLGSADKEVDTFPLDVSLPSHGTTLLQLSGAQNHRIEVSVTAACDNLNQESHVSPGIAMFFAPRRLRRDLAPEASPSKSSTDEKTEGRGSQDLVNSGDGETGKPEDVVKPTMLTELREESLTPTAAVVSPVLPSDLQNPPGSDDLMPGVAIQPMAAEIPLPTDLDPPAANTQVLSSFPEYFNTAVVSAGGLGDQNPPAEVAAYGNGFATENAEAAAVLNPMETAEGDSKPESQNAPKDNAAEDETLPTAGEVASDAARAVNATSLKSTSPESSTDASSPAASPNTTSSFAASGSFVSTTTASTFPSASHTSTISPSTTTPGTPTLPPVTQFVDNTLAAEKTDAAGRELTLMDTFFPPKNAGDATASTDTDVTTQKITVGEVSSTTALEAAVRNLDVDTTVNSDVTEVDTTTATTTTTTTMTTAATTTIATTTVFSDSKTTTGTKQSGVNTTSVDTTRHGASTNSTGDDRGATSRLTSSLTSTVSSSAVNGSTTIKTAPTANSNTSASTAGVSSTTEDVSSRKPSLPPHASRPGHTGVDLNDTVTLGTNWAQTGVTSAWDGGLAVDHNTPKVEDEFFWPIVAALTIGIPSVIVFGIAITVIHKKRLGHHHSLFPSPSSNLD